MVRLFFYVALVLALGFGFAWLADRPGTMVVTWQGRQIEMSLMVAVSAIVALIAAVMFLWWLVRSLLLSPEMVSRYFRARKRDRGYQALSTGLIAAGAGDAAMARKMTQRTRGLLSADQEPLIHLLDAQTALIEGRSEDARAKFEAMVEDPETRELGLRGLYLEARKAGATEAAQHYAEQAAEKAPQLAWAGEAALGFRSAEGAWDDAIRLLEKQRVARVLTKADADRKKAVLLTARGMERLEKGDVAGARVDCVEANRLAPDLVPAGIAAAQALYRENSLGKGSRLLEKLWRKAPHPDVAEAYVRARPGDSTRDRLKRAQKLESIKRNHVESAYAVARAALDAQDFSLAREKAEAAARMGAREGIYLLLADIEEADTNDQGRVRHWLAQAVRAPRDPSWTADGYVAEHWAAVSPVSGKLDAFEWKVPVEQLAGPVEDGEALRASAERAIESLPAVAAAPLAAAGTSIVFADEPESQPSVTVDPTEAVGDTPEPKPKPIQEPKPVPEPEPVPVAAVTDVAEKETTAQTAVGNKPADAKAEAAEADAPAAPEPKAVEERQSETEGQPAETAASAAADAPSVEKADDSQAAPADGESRQGENSDRKMSIDELVTTVEAGEGDEVVKQAAASGETHIVTDAVGSDRDKQREAAFLAKPPDDPGVDESTKEEEAPKSRFRLF